MAKIVSKLLLSLLLLISPHFLRLSLGDKNIDPRKAVKRDSQTDYSLSKMVLRLSLELSCAFCCC